MALQRFPKIGVQELCLSSEPVVPESASSDKEVNYKEVIDCLRMADTNDGNSWEGVECLVPSQELLWCILEVSPFTSLAVVQGHIKLMKGFDGRLVTSPPPLPFQT